MMSGSPKTTDLRRAHGDHAIYTSVVLASLFLESLLAYYFTYDTISLSMFLALHLLVSLAIIGCYYFAEKGKQKLRNRLVQLSILTTIAGPFGAMIAAGLAFPDGTDNKNIGEQNFNDWLDSELNNSEEEQHQKLYRDLTNNRLHIGKSGPPGTIAFIDVMAHGTNEMKFRALAAIRRKYHPSFSNSLNLALQDKNPSVRVLAATVISHLRAHQSENLVKIEALKKEAPHIAKHWLDLAKAHKSCHISELLEEKQSSHHLASAINCLAHYIELAPTDLSAKTRFVEWQLEDKSHRNNLISDYESTGELVDLSLDRQIRTAKL